MIQVYTGNGKGKTTAALGLALRAAGAGLKVYIVQFAKGRECSELNALRKIENIKIEQFGTCRFIKKISKKDVELAQAGLNAVSRALKTKKYNVIILDEINVVLKLGLLRINDVLGVIRKMPKKLELILTGRQANPEILKLADLISEIREIKHYFNRGLKARKGIEF